MDLSVPIPCVASVSAAAAAAAAADSAPASTFNSFANSLKYTNWRTGGAVAADRTSGQGLAAAEKGVDNCTLEECLQQFTS